MSSSGARYTRRMPHRTLPVHDSGSSLRSVYKAIGACMVWYSIMRRPLLFSRSAPKKHDLSLQPNWNCKSCGRVFPAFTCREGNPSRWKTRCIELPMTCARKGTYESNARLPNPVLHSLHSEDPSPGLKWFLERALSFRNEST